MIGGSLSDPQASLAADARLLAVLTEDDHVEGRTCEHLDGTQGFTEAMTVVPLKRCGSAGAHGCWMDGCCAHVSMMDSQT